MTSAGDLPAGLRRPAGLVAGLGLTGQSVVSLLVSHGAHVTAADSRDDDERREHRRAAGEGRRRVRLGPARSGRAAGRHRARRHLARAAAGHSAAGRRRGRRHRGDRATSSWPGGCGRCLPVGGRQQWLAVTGTNGKTTTVRMLARDARRGRAPQRRRRQRRHAARGRGHRSGAVPGRRGRAVQLPAVLEHDDRAARRRRAQPRGAPSGLARRPSSPTRPPRPGSSRPARSRSATRDDARSVAMADDGEARRGPPGPCASGSGEPGRG